VGIAEAAFEAARDYAQEREQFGQRIAEFQGIRWMLSDMKTRLEAARLLTYQAALAKDEATRTGKRYSLEAAMAKLYASEMAMWVTTKAVQIFGGNGYSKEYSVERYFRDAKITEIYEGTSEIQRLVIGRSILG
jgi:alkylation response protein AidB-like acyl-CoA dehydrogenase